MMSEMIDHVDFMRGLVKAWNGSVERRDIERIPALVSAAEQLVREGVLEVGYIGEEKIYLSRTDPCRETRALILWDERKALEDKIESKRVKEDLKHVEQNRE